MLNPLLREKMKKLLKECKRIEAMGADADKQAEFLYNNGFRFKSDCLKCRFFVSCESPKQRLHKTGDLPCYDFAYKE